MDAQIRIRWVLLALICGCGEPDAPAAPDAGPDDAGPNDAAPNDACPDAEVLEVGPIACPPPEDDALPRLELQPPGSWQLEGCEGPVAIEVHFTVPPRTAWLLEATSDTDRAPIVTDPVGENLLDAPAEVVSAIFFDPNHLPLVTIRWVECAESESCGADRYCSLGTYTCTDCADGDELFDTRQSPAPRTDARPRELIDGRASGTACAGFDDWYRVQQPAGQPLELFEGALVYVADPAAGSLADLELIPLTAEVAPEGHVDVERSARVVPPVAADRTVWVRLTTDEPHRQYGFEVGGCTFSSTCLPWWYCDRDGGDVCRACDGVRDAHGDDDVRRSPGGAPIPLTPDRPLDGAICGVDEDWYAVTLGDPASRIEITGAIGFVYLQDVVGDPRAMEEHVLEAGSRIVLRSDMPEWYPDLQVPEVVWVHITTIEEMEDFRGTYAYTIRVEDGDFCLSDHVPCPAGRVCDADSGHCIAAEQ